MTGETVAFKDEKGQTNTSTLTDENLILVEFKEMISNSDTEIIAHYNMISRHEAGDFFNEMSAQILDSYVQYNGCKPNPSIYQREALMIKEAVTDKKDRNEMTEKELSAITTLQKINTLMIKKGVGVDSRKKHILLVAESL